MNVLEAFRYGQPECLQVASLARIGLRRRENETADLMGASHVRGLELLIGQEPVHHRSVVDDHVDHCAHQQWQS